MKGRTTNSLKWNLPSRTSGFLKQAVKEINVPEYMATSKQKPSEATEDEVDEDRDSQCWRRMFQVCLQSERQQMVFEP